VVVTAWTAFAFVSGAPARDSTVTPAPAAADTTGGRLGFRGRMTDRAGRPLGFAQVVIEGSRRAQLQVGAAGVFSIAVAAGDLDATRRSPIELWLDARRPGYRIGLANGAPRLRLEIRARDDSRGARHIVVR